MEKSKDEEVQQVYRWILDGSTEMDLQDAIGQMFPDAKPDGLIAEALKKFEKTLDGRATVLVGWCIEATRDLYRKSVSVGDFNNALRAVKQLKDMAEMLDGDDEE